MYLKGEKVQVRDTAAAWERHRQFPRYFPAPGTEGVVVSARPRDRDVLVQWPKGSTGGHDKWFVLKELVERQEGSETPSVSCADSSLGEGANETGG